MNHARRRSGHSPAAWIAAVVLVLSFPVIYNVWVIIALAACAVLGWWACSHRQPTNRPVTGSGCAHTDSALDQAQADLARLRAQLDQANAEITDLRGQLADALADLEDARASATAAWDQASDRPPRRAIGDTAPLDVLDAEQLANQPMSGVRRIGGQHP
jgi:septal ring factor EnvC (AmiA/AmiB activator)